MPGKVVDPYKRFAGACGEALCQHDAGKNTADQAGAGCYGNSVDLGKAETSLRKGLFNAAIKAFGMGAGGNLWDDAAECRMQVGLSFDDGG